MAGQSKSRSVSDSRAQLLEGLLAHKGRGAASHGAGQHAECRRCRGRFAGWLRRLLRFYDGGEEGAISWLRLVVKRFAWAIGNSARRRGSHRHIVTVEPGELTGLEIVLADSRPQTAELVERTEALERRIALLGQLKADERTALILIGLGASYEEIAELRGWSRTKINRCASEGGARPGGG